VLMLVKVEGDVVEEATLTDFSVSSEVLTHLPARFQARVANEGTVHLQPTGSIEIVNLFGKTVGSVPVNPGLRSVLPESARRYDALWGEEHDEGVSAFMKQWDGFRFGRYTATLRLSYGEEGKTLVASTTFWVVPWMALGASLLGITLFIFGIQAFFAWYAKRVIKKHRQTEK